MQPSLVEVVSVVGAIFQFVGGVLCIIAAFQYDWKSSDWRFRLGWPWNAPHFNKRGRHLMRIGFPLLLIGVLTLFAT